MDDKPHDDPSTHYDLGIAYREMGLFDDAIAEFRSAMRSGEYVVLGHLMIGLCYAELGRKSEAAASFQAGLTAVNLADRERLALLYELGALHARDGDQKTAVTYFQKVYDEDPRYRDVAEKIGIKRKQKPN